MPPMQKTYPQDVLTCKSCKVVLVEISEDFELALSMIKEPVLLANDWDVDLEYLEEGLKQKAIPYYTEDCQKPVPTGDDKNGTMDIVPATNLYIDRRDWESGSEALLWAKEETRKDEECPPVYLEMPEEEPETGQEEPPSVEENKKTQNLLSWFDILHPYTKMAVAAIAVIFLLGFIGILF